MTYIIEQQLKTYFDFYKKQKFLLNKFEILYEDSQPDTLALLRVDFQKSEEHQDNLSELKVLVARLIDKIEDYLISYILDLPQCNFDECCSNSELPEFKTYLNNLIEKDIAYANLTEKEFIQLYKQCLVLGDYPFSVLPQFDHISYRRLNEYSNNRVGILTRNIIGELTIYRGESLSGDPKIWFRESTEFLQIGIGFKIKLFNNSVIVGNY